MSTRANIVLKQGELRRVLYRHCDGYLSGLGQEILDFLKNNESRNIEEISDSLEANEIAFYDGIDVHGDVEFIYLIELSSEGIKVSVKQEILDKQYENGEVSYHAHFEPVDNFTYEFLYNTPLAQ